MSKFKSVLLGLLLCLLIPTTARGVLNGTWTEHDFLFKLGYGAMDPPGGPYPNLEAWHESLNRVDARLAKEVWVGDPGYGPTFYEAVTSVGATNVILRVPRGTHAIAANLAIPANVTVRPERGAIFAVADATTLTLNSLNAGLYQIFSCAGTGKVTFGAGAVKAALPEWWATTRAGDDDSAAMNAALASRAPAVQLAQGTYKCNATVQYYPMQLLGAGASTNDAGGVVKDPATVLESYSDSGYVLTFKLPANGISGWQLSQVRDIYFRGKTGTSYTSGGLRFGDNPYVAGAEQIGRWEVVNCKFRNLDKAIYKPYGQIGFNFHGCQFLYSNYGYYVERSGAANFHGGNDSFMRCEFSFNQLAALYFDCQQSATGQTTLRDCIIENCPGMGIFVYNYMTDWEPGLVIDNLWLEKNADGGSVTINGVAYTPQDVYLRNARLVRYNNSPIRLMTLVNSKVFAGPAVSGEQYGAGGAPYGYENVTQDADSCFICEGWNGTSVPVNSSLYVAGPINMKSLAPYGGALRVSARNKISTQAATLKLVDSFANADSYVFPKVSGAGSAPTGTMVADGRLFDSCCEVTVPADTIVRSPDTYNKQAGDKYIVWTADLKQISGEQIKFFIGNITYNDANAYYIIPGTWTTFAGIAKNPATTGYTYLALVAPAGGAGTVRVSAFQLHVFDTYQEAVAFLDSRVFAIGAEKPRIIFSTQTPTTGTWAVGDICYNTTPVAGGAPGWVCTTAGTPGTWKAMANLAAP